MEPGACNQTPGSMIPPDDSSQLKLRGNHIPSPLAGEGRVRGHNYVALFL